MSRVFDGITRAAARGTTRRQALRGAAGAAGVGLAGLFGGSALASPTPAFCKQGNKVECGEACCDRKTQQCCRVKDDITRDITGGQASVCCPAKDSTLFVCPGTLAAALVAGCVQV